MIRATGSQKVSQPHFFILTLLTTCVLNPLRNKQNSRIKNELEDKGIQREEHNNAWGIGGIFMHVLSGQITGHNTSSWVDL